MNKLFGIAVAAALSMTSTYAWADRLNQLSDERVRQAIAYAIDMDTIVETLLEGKAIVADSMIPIFGILGTAARSIRPAIRNQSCRRWMPLR